MCECVDMWGVCLSVCLSALFRIELQIVTVTAEIIVVIDG